MLSLLLRFFFWCEKQILRFPWTIVLLTLPNAPLATLLQFQKRVGAFISKAESQANPKDSYALLLEKNILGLLPFTLERLKTSLSVNEFGLDDLPYYITQSWRTQNNLYKILIPPEYDLNNLNEFVQETESVNVTVSGLPVAYQAYGAAVVVVKAFLGTFGGALLAIMLLLLIMFSSVKKMALGIFAPVIGVGHEGCC